MDDKFKRISGLYHQLSKYVNYSKFHNLLEDPNDLPEDGAEVLVRTDHNYTVCQYRSNSREFDHTFFDDEDGGGFVKYDSECGYFKFLNVIAWAYFPLYEVKKNDK